MFPSSLRLKLAISFLGTKAKNAFYVCPVVSPAGHCKDTFFAEHDALFEEFFRLSVSCHILEAKIREIIHMAGKGNNSFVARSIPYQKDRFLIQLLFDRHTKSE